MNVVVGTPQKVQAIMTEASERFGPPGIIMLDEIRQTSAAIAAGVLLLMSAAFVSPVDSETVVLVSVSERDTVRVLKHESVHVTLTRMGERDASKKLDLLTAKGREVNP